jgi:hypothetical protein
MFGITIRRSTLLVAAVCIAAGAGTAAAVQASASGDAPAPTAPTKPKLDSTPPVTPRAAAGRLSPAVVATNAHCGQVLTASLTLNGDLNCAGTALHITANNINLNLGGHVISGNSSGFGVDVAGTTDTVQNGVITQFDTGIYVHGKTVTVLNVRATYNNTGIADNGTTTKITTSVAASNYYHGIVSGGTGGVYSGVHELSNGLSGGFYGLYLFGSTTTVTNNVANGNGGYGILDQGFATKFTTTTADFNGLDGLYISEIAAVDGGGNTAKGNGYGGGTPEQCRGIVCK